MCPQCPDYRALGNSQDHSCHRSQERPSGALTVHSGRLRSSERRASTFRHEEAPWACRGSGGLPHPPWLHTVHAFATHTCAFARRHLCRRLPAQGLPSQRPSPCSLPGPCCPHPLLTPGNLHFPFHLRNLIYTALGFSCVINSSIKFPPRQKQSLTVS